MKIYSWNVNGLRSACRKNFLAWLAKESPDFLCLQEIKALPEQLPTKLANLKDYHSFFNCAAKKGYSGVAVYSKEKPISVEKRLGLERFDSEGRFLELHFPHFILIALYLPHGGRQKENLSYKLQAYNYLIERLKKLQGKPLILAGDFNIAHTELDLARPKANKDNVMFTPEEREQIDRILSLGFVDTFRQFHSVGDYYSWWPYHSQARERNLGWRLDYIFTSQALSEQLIGANIQKNALGSDHCPVSVEIGDSA